MEDSETEIQNVVTPDVVELIEKQKREKGRTLPHIFRTRSQEFLTKNDKTTIVEMSDRRYTKTPTGWTVSDKRK